MDMQAIRFPEVIAKNLLRESVTLPTGLQGELNLLFIPFEQWQQSSVDSWIPFAQEIEQTIPFIRYYELPTISKLNVFAKFMINEGMRAGIPNQLARERTITLYVDKIDFRNLLAIETEATITVLLVDREGKIFWRSEGEFSEQKRESLEIFMNILFDGLQYLPDDINRIGE